MIGIHHIARASRRSRLLTLVVLLTATAAPAPALRVPGRGNPRSECYVAVEVEGRKEQVGCDVTYHELMPDEDGIHIVQESCGDECEFNLKLCANVDTPECTPAQIEELRVKGYTDGLLLERPDVPVVGSACGAHLQPVRLTLKPKKSRAKRRLRFVATSADGRPRRDRDVVELVCQRSPRECCGDGIVQRDRGETCEDGDHVDGNGCDIGCTDSECGNCILGVGEICDDDNTTNGDHCDENCTPPRCGNGVVALDEHGIREDCDPAGPATCPDGFVCDADCRCKDPTPCTCAADASKHPVDDNVLTLTVTTSAAPACGATTNASGAQVEALACGQVYVGGGAQVPGQDVIVPVGAKARMAATCDGDTLHISPTGGSTPGCTEPGCLFGTPIEVPGGICVLVSFASGVRGSIECSNWSVATILPLQAELFIHGCPTCDAGAAMAIECSRAGHTQVGTLQLPAFNLVSGHAEERNPDGQFAAYCHAPGTGGCYQGDPEGCAINGDGVPVECTDPSPCDPSFKGCSQRSAGAFGQPSARGIALDGSPPTDLGDGQDHSARLVGTFRVPPSFSNLADGPAGLPGPGAIGLDVSLRLQPTPPPAARVP